MNKKQQEILILEMKNCRNCRTLAKRFYDGANFRELLRTGTIPDSLLCPEHCQQGFKVDTQEKNPTHKQRRAIRTDCAQQLNLMDQVMYMKPTLSERAALRERKRDQKIALNELRERAKHRRFKRKLG